MDKKINTTIHPDWTPRDPKTTIHTDWIPMDSKTRCSVEGCYRHVECRGWCSKHYQRWWRYGEVFPDREAQIRPEPGEAHDLCVVAGCDRPVFNQARGWCGMHYKRWQRYSGTFPARKAQARNNLNEADIPHIRADKRLLRVIAAAYGVSKATIGHVKSRRSWKYVT